MVKYHDSGDFSWYGIVFSRFLIKRWWFFTCLIVNLIFDPSPTINLHCCNFIGIAKPYCILCNSLIFEYGTYSGNGTKIHFDSFINLITVMIVHKRSLRGIAKFYCFVDMAFILFHFSRVEFQCWQWIIDLDVMLVLAPSILITLLFFRQLYHCKYVIMDFFTWFWWLKWRLCYFHLNSSTCATQILVPFYLDSWPEVASKILLFSTWIFDPGITERVGHLYLIVSVLPSAHFYTLLLVWALTKLSNMIPSWGFHVPANFYMLMELRIVSHPCAVSSSKICHFHAPFKLKFICNVGLGNILSWGEVASMLLLCFLLLVFDLRITSVFDMLMESGAISHLYVDSSN